MKPQDLIEEPFKVTMYDFEHYEIATKDGKVLVEKLLLPIEKVDRIVLFMKLGYYVGIQDATNSTAENLKKLRLSL